MKDKKIAQFIGGLGLVCIAILIVYFVLNQKTDDDIFSKKENVSTEVQNILAKDIERNYPATVREIVRLYSRISKCYYNETISASEFQQLVTMQRLLFDEEFLDNNPLESFVNNLSSEIEEMRKTKSTMISYRVQKQSSVVSWESGENKFSSIVASYTLKEDSEYKKTYEEFLLREDESGRWKIVGWRLTDPIEIEE